MVVSKGFGSQRWNADLRDNYLLKLKSSHVRLKEEENSLIWSLNPLGSYTPKDGYKALTTQSDMEVQWWWWNKVWRFKCPSKSHIFMWLLLNNKVGYFSITKSVNLGQFSKKKNSGSWMVYFVQRNWRQIFILLCPVAFQYRSGRKLKAYLVWRMFGMRIQLKQV